MKLGKLELCIVCTHERTLYPLQALAAQWRKSFVLEFEEPLTWTSWGYMINSMSQWTLSLMLYSMLMVLSPLTLMWPLSSITSVFIISIMSRIMISGIHSSSLTVKLTWNQSVMLRSGLVDKMNILEAIYHFNIDWNQPILGSQSAAE